MTESSPVQVTLFDDGLKIANIESTAKSANEDVKKLYDPNLMSVIEKQGTTARFAGETSRYKVLLQRAKNDGIDTTNLEAAYNFLNSFMSTVIGTGDKASDIDRDKYAKALADFNSQMAIIQDTLQNTFDNAISTMQSNVATATQVASQAVITANSAEAVGNQASASASAAQKAGQDASNAYDRLKLNTRNLAYNTGIPTVWNGNGQANQNAPVWPLSGDVTSGMEFTCSFNIESTTGVGQFAVQFYGSNGGSWTGIVSGSLLNGKQHIVVHGNTSYKENYLDLRLDNATGTITVTEMMFTNSTKEVMWAPAETVIDNAVIGNAQIKDASINTAKINEISANKLSAGTIDANVITVKNLNASNITTGKIGANHIDVGSLSALSADLGTITAGTLKSVDIVSRNFSTPNGTFTVDGNGNITATSLSLIGNKNCVYNSELLGDGAGWSKNAGYVDWATAHSGTYGMVFKGTSGPNDWISFGQSKPMKLTQSNDQAYSLSVWFIDWTSSKGMQYVATLAFLDSNKNRIDSGSKGAQYTNPDGSSHTWQLLTVDNAMPPAGTQYVVIQYWAHAGTGYAGFSQPMISQSSRYQGYTADTGNVLSSGQVILDNNGTLTTTYDGINQDDEYYHSWNFARGTLSIGKGFITSNAHGVRTINGSNTEADVKGTLAAGYTKFTSSTGGRTYMDADLISLSTKSMTDMVVINSNGVHVNDQGITYVGGLNGSSSWGQFGGIRIGNGANTHTINSPSSDWIYFEQGIGDGNTLETIVAANLSSSSQLSKKKTVVEVKPSGSVVANTNLATYLYKGETNVHGLHMSPIIDDVNTQRKYYISPEIMALDGETIDINKATFYGWSAIQALQRANERLQIRLRKLEIERSSING